MKNSMVILPHKAGESQSFTTKDTQQRSPKGHASDLPLLQLLEQTERSPQPALRVEPVPEKLAVAPDRFWLIHSESDLRIPGSFTKTEVEVIFKAVEYWPSSYWEIDTATLKPACSCALARLLEQVCYQPLQTGEKRGGSNG